MLRMRLTKLATIISLVLPYLFWFCNISKRFWMNAQITKLSSKEHLIENLLTCFRFVYSFLSFIQIHLSHKMYPNLYRIKNFYCLINHFSKVSYKQETKSEWSKKMVSNIRPMKILTVIKSKKLLITKLISSCSINSTTKTAKPLQPNNSKL